MWIIIKVCMVATVFSKTLRKPLQQCRLVTDPLPHPPTATQIKKERRKESRWDSPELAQPKTVDFKASWETTLTIHSLISTKHQLARWMQWLQYLLGCTVGNMQKICECWLSASSCFLCFSLESLKVTEYLLLLSWVLQRSSFHLFIISYLANICSFYCRQYSAWSFRGSIQLEMLESELEGFSWLVSSSASVIYSPGLSCLNGSP